MEAPLVSVVTPSLDQGRYIEDAIRSVREQSYANVEHIVIDGGSTDGTTAILERHPEVTWVSEPDRGQSEALNKGLRLARGEILGWLNSDDAYLPGTIQAVVSYFDANPQTTLAFGNFVSIDEDGNVLLRKPARPFDLKAALRGGNTIPQVSAFFRRDVLATVGYFDERYHYVMDVEFWIRTARAGLRIDYVDADWGLFRVHAQSKTMTQAPQFWGEMRDVSRRHGGPRVSKLLVLPVWDKLYRRLVASRLHGVARSAKRALLGLRRYRGRKGS